jgi:MtN3 and saliva related transmembrane protein
MDDITTVGLVAAAFTTASLFPQFYKALKVRNKPTKDKSQLTYSFLFCIGIFLWLLYGMYKNDIAIMIANALSFAQGVVIFVVQLRRLRMPEVPLVSESM